MENSRALVSIKMIYIKEKRIDVIAKGIERCMKILNIPLKVTGVLMPKLNKFEIKFESGDEHYCQSSVIMNLDNLDYLEEDKSHQMLILTSSGTPGVFSSVNSVTNLVAYGIQKSLYEFYYRYKNKNIDVDLFKNLKNIIVTARHDVNIKDDSNKDKFIIEFNIVEN